MLYTEHNGISNNKRQTSGISWHISNRNGATHKYNQLYLLHALVQHFFDKAQLSPQITAGIMGMVESLNFNLTLG